MSEQFNPVFHRLSLPSVDRFARWSKEMGAKPDVLIANKPLLWTRTAAAKMETTGVGPGKERA